MDIEIEGLDELERQIRSLADLEGGVPMEEIFTQEFMRMYTDFGSFEELLEESQWSVQSQSDFEEIPEDEFDKYINESTEFSSWEEMLQIGGSKYFERKLGG